MNPSNDALKDIQSGTKISISTLKAIGLKDVNDPSLYEEKVEEGRKDSRPIKERDMI